mgnify:CR=1 FL=1
MSGSGGVSSSPLDDVRASANAQINQPKVSPVAAFTADPDQFTGVSPSMDTRSRSTAGFGVLSATMKKAIVSLSIIGSLALVLFL